MIRWQGGLVSGAGPVLRLGLLLLRLPQPARPEGGAGGRSQPAGPVGGRQDQLRREFSHLQRLMIIDSFQTNEVTTDYNAGFQSAVAGLNQAFN